MNKVQCPNGHYFDSDMFSECPQCKRWSESKERTVLDRIQEGVQGKNWLVDKPLVQQNEKNLYQQAQEVSGSSEEKTVSFFERRHAYTGSAARAMGQGPNDQNKLVDMDAPVLVPAAVSEYDEKTEIIRIASRPFQDAPEPEVNGEPSANAEVPKQMADPIDPIVGWLVCIQGKRYGECFTIGAGKNSIGRGSGNRIRIEGDAQVSRSQHAHIIYEPKSRKFFLQPGDSSGLTYLNQQLVLMPELLKERDEIGLNESRFLFIPLCNESFSWETTF